MPGVFIATESVAQAEELALALKDSKIDNATVINPRGLSYQKIPRLPNGTIGSTFTTKEHAYRIIPPEDGVGFHRWAELMKQLIPFQFGMRNADQIVQYFNEVNRDGAKMASDGTATVHFVTSIATFLDGIIEQTEERNMAAAYICTIFIVKEDEDLSKWSTGLADQKIADWNANNYDANDFFMLALRLSKGYANEYLSRLEKQKEVASLLGGRAAQ